MYSNLAPHWQKLLDTQSTLPPHQRGVSTHRRVSGLLPQTKVLKEESHGSTYSFITFTDSKRRSEARFSKSQILSVTEGRRKVVLEEGRKESRCRLVNCLSGQPFLNLEPPCSTSQASGLMTRLQSHSLLYSPYNVYRLQALPALRLRFMCRKMKPKLLKPEESTRFQDLAHTKQVL